MNATGVTQHSLDVRKAALAAENPLLGTWKLQSLVYETTATKERSSPFGDHPHGYLGYARDGRMYAILVAEDRPKSDPVLLSDKEKVKLLESISAYAGTYTADCEKVVHHVDTSWNGSWTGTDQVRFYKLNDDTLTITTAPLTALVERKLRWSWYGRKYTRKHKTIGRATCAHGGESRYIIRCQ